MGGSVATALKKCHFILKLVVLHGEVLKM